MKSGKLTLLFEIFFVSTKLGLTSFGGPTAHLAYFRNEYIQKRKWLTDEDYADLVALCQFLPGPASSQVGIGIGVLRAGISGGIVSFLGFTLPSVMALILFALFFQQFDLGGAGWIHSLKIVAVAIVAHAILSMAQQLTPDLKRKMIALFALAVTLLSSAAFTQVGVILISAIIGLFIFKHSTQHEADRATFAISRTFAVLCLTLFFGLLVLLPILREITSSQTIALFDSFYRSGAFVFGGGHVVLPLLEREFVAAGFVSAETFLAGYGATQAVPGPLFTFAAYLGAIMAGWKGGLLATIAIFLPAFLLIFGTLPFWDTLRQNRKIKGALLGVNAAVVGILIAAFYQPIWTSTILNAHDFVFVAVLFSLLMYGKLPAWAIVILGIVGGIIFF